MLLNLTLWFFNKGNEPAGAAEFRSAGTNSVLTWSVLVSVQANVFRVVSVLCIATRIRWWMEIKKQPVSLGSLVPQNAVGTPTGWCRLLS